MHYISILKPIIFYIKGYDDYGFSDDKLLYDLKRNKLKKQINNNGTLGYVFDKKFISLKNIKPLLYKYNKLPF